MPLPASSAARCDQCGQPLSALRAARSRVCERPACAARADAARQRQLRSETEASLRSSVRDDWGPSRADAAGIAWLPAHAVEWVDLRPEQRESLARHLQAVCEQGYSAAAAELERARGWIEADERAAALAAPAPAADGAACGLCRGRCCRPGAAHHAFIGFTLLQRWTAAHPGLGVEDAAQAYLAALPSRHARGSCPFHGPEGCSLPRGWRSDMCNRYACEGLLQMRADVRRDWIIAVGVVEGERRVAALAAPSHNRAGTAGQP